MPRASREIEHQAIRLDNSDKVIKDEKVAAPCFFFLPLNAVENALQTLFAERIVRRSRKKLLHLLPRFIRIECATEIIRVVMQISANGRIGRYVKHQNGFPTPDAAAYAQHCTL